MEFSCYKPPLFGASCCDTEGGWLTEVSWSYKGHCHYVPLYVPLALYVPLCTTSIIDVVMQWEEVYFHCLQIFLTSCCHA